MTENEVLKKYGENFGWYSHMIDHCETALDGIERTGTLENLAKDRLIFKGVVMSLQALGELLKDLPDRYKLLDDTISNRLIGFRNRSAHGYHAIDPGIVREIVLTRIPKILHELKLRQHQKEGSYYE